MAALIRLACLEVVLGVTAVRDVSAVAHRDGDILLVRGKADHDRVLVLSQHLILYHVVADLAIVQHIILVEKLDIDSVVAFLLLLHYHT